MNSKMYKIGFAILLVINISLIVLFTTKPRPPAHLRGMERKMGIKDDIIQDLAFDDDQMVVFEELVNNHRSAIRELRKKESTLMESYFDQLSSRTGDKSKEAVLNEIMQLKREKIAVTFSHFEEVKSICNKEQLAKFDLVLKQIVPKMINSSERRGKPSKPHR